MNHLTGTNHVFLHPGEYVVATAACTIHTLLGSCVSIVLWHPEKRIGAMSHAIVPSRADHQEFPLSGRYADEVLTLMLLELERLGIDPRDCRAGVFGGSNVLLPLRGQPDLPSIGRKNGEAAKEQLAENGINVVAESLFGTGYRKVMFDISSGDMRVRVVGVDDDDDPDMDTYSGSDFS